MKRPFAFVSISAFMRSSMAYQVLRSIVRSREASKRLIRKAVEIALLLFVSDGSAWMYFSIDTTLVVHGALEASRLWVIQGQLSRFFNHKDSH
jgi:hypothetical protein